MGISFRENVRDELEYQGVSIKELAEKTQIPYQTVENYLNSRASMPPADYACRIAKVLHTTVERLIGDDANLKNNESNRQNAYIITLLNRLAPEDKQAFLRLLTTIANQ